MMPTFNMEPLAGPSSSAAASPSQLIETIPDIHPNSSVLDTTEKVLIFVWVFFTVGVFTFLYKVTNEADKEELKMQ